MASTRLSALLLVAVTPAALAGCQGVRFADDALNSPAPESLISRNLWPESAVYKYTLSQLLGRCFYVDQNNKVQRQGRQLLKDGYIPNAKAIPVEQGLLYSSKVDSRAELKTSYLAFAASLSTNEIADVSIQDTTVLAIDSKDIPYDAINKEILAHPPGPGERFLYMSAVLLTSITRKTYSEISADASGVIGDTVGANGKVFNSRQSFVRDYRISFEALEYTLNKTAVLGPSRFNLGPRNLDLSEDIAGIPGLHVVEGLTH